MGAVTVSMVDATAAIPSAPKVGLLCAATTAPTLGQRVLGAEEMVILIRMISIGQLHRAVPLSGALCLAAACRVPNSAAWNLLAESAKAGPVRISHPSGVVLVDAEVQQNRDGGHVRQATVFRTAWRLF